MRRIARWLVVVLVFAGCKGATNNVVDPFVGRTTVEPPRTGWIQGQPATDPYYPSQPQTAAQPLARPQASAASSSPDAGWMSTNEGPAVADDSAQRPSIFEANRSAIRIPPPSIGTSPSDRYPDVSVAAAALPAGPPQRTVAPNEPATRVAATSSAVATAHSPATNEGVIRVIEPRTTAPAVAAVSRPASAEPRPIDPASAANARPIASPARCVVVPASTQTTERSINIVDLPQTRGGTPLGTVSSESSAVQFASAVTDTAQDGSAVRAASFSTRTRYGHDPQYRWLRGQLEYSQIDRRWKLRYIPIDGATDQHGGSVVLSDATLLSGYERGDFVEVHGTLGQKATDDNGYAPVYEVASIKQPAG